MYKKFQLPPNMNKINDNDGASTSSQPTEKATNDENDMLNIVLAEIRKVNTTVEEIKSE